MVRTDCSGVGKDGLMIRGRAFECEKGREELVVKKKRKRGD